jgi:hypothetical protein
MVTGCNMSEWDEIQMADRRLGNRFDPHEWEYSCYIDELEWEMVICDVGDQETPCTREKINGKWISKMVAR